jgi:hypothetical protein
MLFSDLQILCGDLKQDHKILQLTHVMENLVDRDGNTRWVGGEAAISPYGYLIEGAELRIVVVGMNKW